MNSILRPLENGGKDCSNPAYIDGILPKKALQEMPIPCKTTNYLGNILLLGMMSKP